MKLSFVVVILLILLAPFPTSAQELDCSVTFTNIETLPAEARDNISDFIPQVEEYMNSYHWTNVDFGDDRIRCTINISFLGAPRNNHYVVKAFIGSQRPVRHTDRNTAMIRLMDDAWEFDYVRNQSLTHADYRFDPLLSFLDFYAYVILGYDFDSYKADDGTPYFQKALDIANRARGASAGKGWQISSQSIYSRGQLIDDLLNAKYDDVRDAVYRYHARGLDLMYKDSLKAMKNILSSLEKIGKLREKINSSILIATIFFDTKYLEIADVFVNYPDPSVYETLMKADPNHQQTYLEYAEKVADQ
jgi:hypothetical protein